MRGFGLLSSDDGVSKAGASRPASRRRFAARSLFLGAALLISASCGGSTEGSTAGPIPVADLPSAYASAVCDVIAPCCSGLGVSIDPSTCRSTVISTVQASINEANPANYKYDANAAEACLASTRSALASCQSPGNPGTCDAAFQGKLAKGAVCTSSIECASPSDGTASCSGGVCVVKRRGKVGDPCYWSCHEEGTSTFCSGTGINELQGQSRCFDNDGLYCSDTGTCTQQKQNGVACSDDQECTSGRCDFTSSLCVPKGTEGQACTFDSDCIDTLYCDDTTSTSTCAQKKAANAPCTFDTECQSNSCTGTQCAAQVTGTGSSAALHCALASGGFPTP